MRNIFRTHGTTLRIAMGQSSVLITLLLLGAFFGLIPDRNMAVMEGRAALAESIAANTSIFITRSDLRRMEANLRLVIKRNPDILSAGVRTANDKVLITVGDHLIEWKADGDSNSQLVVPIWEGEKRWGQMELRFKPLLPAGPFAFMYHPTFMLIGFLAISSTFFFFIYLRKMLKDLDPSQAIPDRVRSALDTMAEGLLVLDARQNIVLANNAFSTLVDISPAELLGQKVSIFDWSNMDDSSMERKDYPWTEALKNCEAQRNVSVRLKFDGEERRTFQTNCSPVLASDDKAGGVLISFDDITVLEEKEKQLRQSKREAEMANKAKSHFLANMSHEIRTPMNAIMGFTDVLKRAYQTRSDDQVDKNSLHYLNTIANSSQHLLDLINDILDLSKVEAGRVEVETMTCSIHQIIHDVIQVMQVKADEKGLTLEYLPEGDLPASIQSDPARLRQILTNLVGNAIKFTERGKVVVTSKLSWAAAEPLLRVAVSDSGIGMTEEQASAVFDPFVQADSSITRRFGGTGLGLSICKRYAEAMGGSVSVKSELGKGSTFAAIVPVGDLAGVPMLSPAELVAAVAQVEEIQSGRWIFEPGNVLVVDDGPENRELLSVVLEDAGLNVSTACDGKEGIDKLVEGQYDLVLMDVQMPVMDGYTAVRKMRESGCSLPIIALTGDAMKGAEQACLDAGYSGYMSKPIVIDKLIARLAEDLGGEFHEMAEEPQFPGDEAASVPGHSVPNDDLPELRTRQLEPVLSSLPVDNDKYRDIIMRFVGRLQHQLMAIEAAAQNRDYKALQDLGHWLKGSAGSVGFHMFDEPGLELENFARAGDDVGLEKVVSAIGTLVDRVIIGYPEFQEYSTIPAEHDVVDGESDSGPASDNDLPDVVTSTMMGNTKLQPLVCKFVTRLSLQLEVLEQAANASRFDEVADLAHWLKGSAGTVGFDAFTGPATELEAFAKDSQAQAARDKISTIRALYERIDVPLSEKTA